MLTLKTCARIMRASLAQPMMPNAIRIMMRSEPKIDSHTMRKISLGMAKIACGHRAAIP